MGTRMSKEDPVEMDMGMEMEVDELERGEQESDAFLQVDTEIQIQMLEPEVETEIEDWVGVHSLNKMPKSFKPQEPSIMDFSQVIQSIKTQEKTKAGFSGQSRNIMTRLFCSPEGDENQLVLKHLFKKLKKRQRKFCPTPRYKLILVDAKDSEHLKQSFKKVAKILTRRKVDKKNRSTEEIMDKIYEHVNIETGPNDKIIFVFVGAEGSSEITPFLPKDQVVLPFCQFLVTTSSKTFNWESDSEKWSNKNFLLFDKELIEFDWEGVHSASKLPPSFQPVRDFTSRAEIMSQLVQQIKNIPSIAVLETVPHFHSDREKQVQMERQISSVKSPPPPRASFTLISGVRGIGKTELVKKFLSTHPHFFAKAVLINAENLWLPLKIFSHNSGIYSEATEPEPCKSFAFPHSTITEEFQGNERLLIVIDNADRLEQIKDCLPKNSAICHVVVTSRSRDWEKADNVKFYKDNGYDFQELPLFDGLSLDETHEFCSQILPRNEILYKREDLERSIRELHKLTGGFPLALQNLTTFISKSSRSNPEWTSSIHILNYLRQDFHQFRHETKPFDWDQRFEVSIERKSSGSRFYGSELQLLRILCLMDPEHLDFDMICYFFFEHQTPFKPPAEERRSETVRFVEFALWKLEMDSLIQVDRRSADENDKDNDDGDGKVQPSIIRVRVPAFLRESMNAEKTETSDSLRNFLYGLKLPHSSWTRPLDVPRLWPHILSLNESYTRFHGYHNQVLIECIQNHLEFWKNPPKKEIPGEEGQRPNTDYETEKEKIRKLLQDHPDFKRTFGDFSQMENPGFLLPILFLILFVVDVGSDLNNALMMFNAEYYAHFGLSLFLVICPFIFLCGMHHLDRTEYNRKMKNHRRMRCWDFLTTLTGTFHSYFLRLWYIWKFKRETGNMEKRLLYERLCVLRANAEYHGIAEAFMESLPQLLLQFPLYLLSYTQEYSGLKKVMRDSLIPFELSLVVSLCVFGLALTKVESVYFGWNMDIFGVKLLGYRCIHLLVNVTHGATLVFCSGIVSVVLPWFSLVISLVFNISATDWVYSDSDAQESAPSCCSALQPGFVEKWSKLESSLKHEFVSAKLGHDTLFLRRAPTSRDVIYLFIVISSVLISAFTAIYSTFFQEQFPIEVSKTVAKYVFAFPIIQTKQFYFILWLPLLFVWQLLRQLLNVIYLKYFKVPPLTEDYVLNDPEGIFRHPADSERLIQLRLYYQMRQNVPSALAQTWEQLKQTAREN